MGKTKSKFVCTYTHCFHKGEEVDSENAVKIGTRYYHPDCAEYKKNIELAKELYINSISGTVVVKSLLSAINNIVFKKNVDPKYLVFAIRHAITSNIEIKSPWSLHYLVDNKRIKQLWDKQKLHEQEKLIAGDMLHHMKKIEEDTVFCVSSPTKPKGFGDIFGGG